MGIFDWLFKPDVEKLKEERDIRGLVEALGHKNRKVRRSAATALAVLAHQGIADETAMNALNKALSDEDSYVSDFAGEAFVAMLKSKRDIKGLIDALSHRVSQGTSAAKALGEIGDETAIDPLIKALGDVIVRKSAIRSLGKLKATKAVQPLIKALKDSYQSYEKDVYKAATEALMRFETGEAREALTEYQVSPPSAVYILGRGFHPGFTDGQEVIEALLERYSYLTSHDLLAILPKAEYHHVTVSDRDAFVSAMNEIKKKHEQASGFDGLIIDLLRLDQRYGRDTGIVVVWERRVGGVKIEMLSDEVARLEYATWRATRDDAVRRGVLRG